MRRRRARGSGGPSAETRAACVWAGRRAPFSGSTVLAVRNHTHPTLRPPTIPSCLPACRYDEAEEAAAAARLAAAKAGPLPGGKRRRIEDEDEDEDISGAEEDEEEMRDFIVDEEEELRED